GGAEGITFGSFDPANMFNPAMFSILGVGFAAFMGFESTALYREEARDPDKTIPRATYISVIFMAVFYGFIVWAIIIGLGETNAVAAAGENPAGLVFAQANHYLGGWAEFVMYLLI
ncbi:amino acid permease, partial [Rhizobium johnstonii]|uniref:amino acid permease n=1 Tax=Rhizobium johnstonii TaxID=3019933 RepID=UPI003F94B780